MNKRSDYLNRRNRYFYGLYLDATTKAVLLFASNKNRKKFMEEINQTGQQYACCCGKLEAVRLIDNEGVTILEVDSARNVHQVEV